MSPTIRLSALFRYYNFVIIGTHLIRNCSNLDVFPGSLIQSHYHLRDSGRFGRNANRLVPLDSHASRFNEIVSGIKYMYICPGMREYPWGTTLRGKKGFSTEYRVKCV